jgi:hypothetical protein
MNSITKMLRKQINKQNMIRTFVILSILFLLYLYLGDKLEGMTEDNSDDTDEVEDNTIDDEDTIDAEDTIGDEDTIGVEDAKVNTDKVEDNIVLPAENKLTNPNKLHQLQYADLVMANSMKIIDLKRQVQSLSNKVVISTQQAKRIQQNKKNGKHYKKEGLVKSTKDSDQTFTFPTAFPNECISVVVGGTNNTNDFDVKNITKTGFTLNRRNAISNTDPITNVQYVAHGY